MRLNASGSTTTGGFERRLALLTATLAAAAWHTAPAAAQAPPDELHLTGMVRDFSSTHADFDVTPAAGLGHYAANVEMTLGPDERPLFADTGYKVTVEWTDTNGRAIAPNLYEFNAGGGGGAVMPNVLTNERLRCRNAAFIDSYDSAAGPYGGANVGANARVATNSIAPDMIVIENSSFIYGDVLIGPGGDPDVVVDVQGADGLTGTIDVLDEVVPMPDMTVPVGIAPYTGMDLNIPVNGTMTVSGNWHVDLFNVRRGATVTINGDVTVICEDRFLVNKNATILVPDGSSLTVYCRTQARLYGPSTVVNPDTANPSKVKVYILGSDPWSDQFVANGNGTMFCGRLYAPDNVLDLDQSAEFFGTFLGKNVEANNQAKLHVDLNPYETMGSCVTVADNPGLAGASDHGGISGAASFDDWYHDVLGVNQSIPHVVTLTRNVDGVYEYLNSGFYPIDDQLLGNEGDSRNHYFTYAIEADFTYDACEGQFIGFQGGDGAWMYVGGELMLDLGGVLSIGEQYVELDRLGLVDGQTYTMHLFYADRHDFSAVFRLRTNVVLTSDNVLPSLLALFD